MDIVTVVSIPILIIGASAFLKPRPDTPPPKTVHYIKNIRVFGPLEDWDVAIAVEAVGKAVRLRKAVRPEATYVDISVHGRRLSRTPYDASLQPLIDSQDKPAEHYRYAKEPLPDQEQSALPELPENDKDPVHTQGNIVSTKGRHAVRINAATIIAIRHHPLRIWTHNKGTITCIEPKRLQKELATVLLRHPAFSDRPM